MHSIPWQDNVDDLYHTIFSFDGTGTSKTNVEFLRLIDPDVFEQLARIGETLQGEDFLLFCQKIRQHNHRELQDDHDYGHMGLGLCGMQAVFSPLSAKLSSFDERRAVLECVLAGQSVRSFKI